MSTLALLCLAALIAVVIVSIVGVFSSGKASLDEVYARRRARTAAMDGPEPTDQWVTDARTHPELVPQ